MIFIHIFKKKFITQNLENYFKYPNDNFQINMETIGIVNSFQGDTSTRFCFRKVLYNFITNYINSP